MLRPLRPTCLGFKESTVRFDALLEDTAQVAGLILEAATNKLNSSFPSQASPGREWHDWGEGGDHAIMAGVTEALSGAAGSVHDQMEEELMIAAERGGAEMLRVLAPSAQYRHSRIISVM